MNPQVKELKHSVRTLKNVIVDMQGSIKDRDKSIAAMKQGLAEQATTVIALRGEAVRNEKTIEAYQLKNEFITKPGRETLIVKIGSLEHKWMPSPAQFAAATKRIKHAKLDEKYNVLLTHVFTDMQVL